jgi:hypothetical protein
MALWGTESLNFVRKNEKSNCQKIIEYWYLNIEKLFLMLYFLTTILHEIVSSTALALIHDCMVLYSFVVWSCHFFCVWILTFKCLISVIILNIYIYIYWKYFHYIYVYIYTENTNRNEAFKGKNSNTVAIYTKEVAVPYCVYIYVYICSYFGRIYWGMYYTLYSRTYALCGTYKYK